MNCDEVQLQLAKTGHVRFTWIACGLSRGTTVNRTKYIVRKSIEVHRFSFVPQVLFHMPPRNSGPVSTGSGSVKHARKINQQCRAATYVHLSMVSLGLRVFSELHGLHTQVRHDAPRG